MRNIRNFTNKNDSVGDNEFLKSALGKYGGMNEDQLTDELMRKIAESRKDGSFSVEKLEEFRNTVYPQLSRTQQMKLDNLIGVIKAESSR